MKEIPLQINCGIFIAEISSQKIEYNKYDIFELKLEIKVSITFSILCLDFQIFPISFVFPETLIGVENGVPEPKKHSIVPNIVRVVIVMKVLVSTERHNLDGNPTEAVAAMRGIGIANSQGKK